MIDGIKTACLSLNAVPLAEQLGVELNGQTTYIKESGLIFGFDERVDTSTGELRNVCTLRGSLHKRKNLGAHNADRFYLYEVSQVLDELKERYLIDANITQLYSVEFGVNIQLPYSPQRVINAIRTHKSKSFCPMGKVGLIYETALYDLKIYDKGKQCGIPGYENVLRIEIKATGKYLKSKYCGIVVLRLSNLLDTGLWECFESLLLKAIDDTMILESVPGNQLTQKEKGLFDLFFGDGWQTLDRKNLYKKKVQLKELADRTGASDLKNQIRELITKECQILRAGDKRRFFENERIEPKINFTNKSQLGSIEGKVTNDGFSMATPKDRKVDKRRIKIKASNVPTDPPPTAPTQPGKDPPLFVPKILDSVQIRGKPTEYEGKLI